MRDHWNKVHILGVLSIARGLGRYLEITTSTTGGRYAEAVALSFPARRRLVYLTTGASHDGLPIDYFSDTEDISAPLAEIRRSGENLILVDAHHTMECASRDLREAFSLVAHGGALVIHDCNPPRRLSASPVHHAGEWCGVSYRAYLDFVLCNPRLDYFTLDTDYGCGIILKPKRRRRGQEPTATFPATCAPRGVEGRLRLGRQQLRFLPAASERIAAPGRFRSSAAKTFPAAGILGRGGG